ncbi:hypothetical protein [Myxococcus virescens]|uniref:Uncharacterized protein n=1 Tax=Myxococcus virescens TaxID=83456 RepID=A0A511H483_9BACT|nr:hypothetical protein [Myxococcus virescens]GEL68310.1 hypothetical protein MVI01_00940 [Myxococcus virescens]SDE97107.1 hypothetical protein SAMN04488504_1169 [Myxococcus virescens]
MVLQQPPGNVKRFGPQALHNTENVIPQDKDPHTNVSSLYSSVRIDNTQSLTQTVRQGLSTQSYEAQREFGLLAIENVKKRVW